MIMSEHLYVDLHSLNHKIIFLKAYFMLVKFLYISAFAITYFRVYSHVQVLLQGHFHLIRITCQYTFKYSLSPTILGIHI